MATITVEVPVKAGRLVAVLTGGRGGEVALFLEGNPIDVGRWSGAIVTELELETVGHFSLAEKDALDAALLAAGAEPLPPAPLAGDLVAVRRLRGGVPWLSPDQEKAFAAGRALFLADFPEDEELLCHRIDLARRRFADLLEDVNPALTREQVEPLLPKAALLAILEVMSLRAQRRPSAVAP